MPVHPPERATRGSDRLIGTFTLAAIAAAIAAATALSSSAILTSAPTPTLWQFEDVAAGHLIPGCVDGMTLAGFDHDLQGRPVVAWREENRCGAPPRVFWTRQDGGAWTTHEFLSERQYDGGGKDGYFHQLVLRPSDGNPFLVYRDVTTGNTLNTYRTDLGAFPNGGASQLLEALAVHPQCATVNYSLAFAPGGVVPDWATGLAECNDLGPVRLNGMDAGIGYKTRPALTVTPDGVRHMLWNSGSNLFYSRWAPGDAAPTTSATPIFASINQFGGEVTLESDASGVLCAAIRGVEGNQSDADLGAIVYIESKDGGQSWTPFEYVDPNDAVPNSIGINHGISLAVGPDGVPAVTYWRSNTELWYARRDGPNGTWTNSLVTTAPTTSAPRSTEVDFDANGNPVVAFFDVAAGMLRLARLIPGPPANRAPALVSPGDRLSAEHEIISVPLSAPDPDGDTVIFSATGLPPGLGVDVNTKSIAGRIARTAAGVYPVTLTASDGTLATSVDLTWTVLHTPCNPIAQNDSALTAIGAAIDILVLDNDVIPSSCIAFGPATFSGVTQPPHGAVVLDGKLRTATYTPAAGFAGTDTFTYTIANTAGDTATATVTVTVANLILVNTTAQTPAADSDCTLASAIVAANTNGVSGGCAAGRGDDIIVLPAGTYVMTEARYLDPNGYGVAALPGITADVGNRLEIRGAGSGQTKLVRTGAVAMRFFVVYGDLTLRNLSVEGGQSTGDGGVALLIPGPSSSFGGSLSVISSRFAFNSAKNGGVAAGVSNYERSRFEAVDSVFTANHAGATNIFVDGMGGVYNGQCNGSAVVTRSRFDGNGARFGGAISTGSCSGLTPLVAVTDSTFVDNTAGLGQVAGSGGAIVISGDLVVVRSRFLHNRAGLHGGAIDGARGTITETTFADNVADTNGGAINSGTGALTVSGSTFARNVAGFVGGALMLNDVSATVTNSTFSANVATDNGGAIFIGSSRAIRFNSLTVTGTRSPSAIFSGHGSEGPVEVANSVIAGNAADFWLHSHGIVTSGGYNLIGNADGGNIAPGPGDKFGTTAAPFDARLGPLAPNGGLTETHMPMAGSPLVDMGNPSAPGLDFPACEALDQRGVVRAGAGTLRCDIGAVERVVTTEPMLSIGKTAMTPFGYVGQPVTYRITVVNTGGGLATGVVVTDRPVQMTPTGATASQGTCTIGGGTVTCDLGAIEPDATVTIDVNVLPTVAGVLRNSVTVTADNGVPDGGLSASGDVVAREPIRVNTTLQIASGPSDCTLGDAIRAANTDRAVNGCRAGNGRDLIILPAGTYTMDVAQVIDPNDGPAALPKVESLIEIRGAGVDQSVIERGPTASEMRFFEIVNAGELTLAAMRVRRGRPDPTFSRNGGAVMGGTLIADTVVFEQNTVTGSGGVFAPGAGSRGFLRAVNSRFERNSAQQSGGVAFNSRFDAVASTFLENSADAGGVYQGNCDAVTAATSTFTGNTARFGGAIHTAKCSTILKTLTLTDSTFTDNTATQGGGAIVAGSISTIVRTRFLRNRAVSHSGGAIQGVQGTILDSTFADNLAGTVGGAIETAGDTVTVRGSTFARNVAAQIGGGLMVTEASAVVTNSTFSANAATDNGGAIFIAASRPMRFNNLTITGSVSPSAIYNGWGAEAIVEVSNSIIAGNVSDVWWHSHGSVTSLGHMLIGNDDGGNITPGPKDKRGTTAVPIDPRLGPLQANGGPTETHALLDGSPAFDEGNGGPPGTGGATCEARDQRGVVRPGSGSTVCDIGAVESAVDSPPVIQNPGNQTSDEGTTVDLRIDAGDPDGQPLSYSVDALKPLPPGLAIDADRHIRGLLGFQSAGNYQVALQVSDGRFVSMVQFWWTVRNVPCSPIANNDAVTTPLNTAVDILALANDVGPAACGPIGFTVSSFSTAGHGAVTFDSKLRTFSYVPATDFTGIDTFTYTIVNSDGGASTATVTITVAADPIRVNTTTQNPVTDADCTLSQAIEAANSHNAVGGCAAGGSPAVILLPPGTYTLTSINNTTAGRANGLPVVTTDLTIRSDGGNATNTIIERATDAPAFGIFHIASNHQFTLIGVTVRGGVDDRGGAVFADGGTLTLTNSAFVGNRGGGAINGATVNADASTFSGNHGGQGGALKITRGGLFVNVTISGNTAVHSGGGIWFEGTDPLDLRNVTIVGNEAIDTVGGGVYVEQGVVHVANSIVAGNAARDGDFDLSGIPGSFASRGFNLIGIHPGAALANLPSDQVGTVAAPIDPRLGPLQHNGGTTATRLPLPGSTALDRGNAFALPADPARCAALDQRGLGRPADGTGDGITTCDIGAVEALLAEVAVLETTTALTASPNPATVGMDVTLTATVTSPIPGAGTPIGAVTFKDGDTVLATVTLTDGSAVFDASGLAVGDHAIAAEYSGDTFFQPSHAAVVTLTIDLPPPAVINITERIGVSDSVGVVKSVMFTVVENIAVQDAPKLVPSVMFTVAENIAVRDTPAVVPSALLTVTEQIAVQDAPAVVPSALLTVTERIAVQDAPVARPSALLAVSETIAVADSIASVGPVPRKLPSFALPITGSATVGAQVTVSAVLSVTAGGGVDGTGIPTGTVTFTLGAAADGTPVSLGTGTVVAALVTGVAPGGGLGDVGTVTFVGGAISGVVTVLYQPPGSTEPPTVLGEVPATADLVSADVVGVAILTTTLPAGVAKIEAVYSGDAKFLPNRESRDQIVNNTLPGVGVTVKPIDPTTGGTPVAVTFANVTQPGLTSVTTSSVGPTSPTGFQLGEPPLYFDISTTAVFTGTIEVCIDYAGTVFKRTDGLRLFHFEGGAWVNRTESAAGTSICAVVTSLSPFAIFEPINASPVAAGDLLTTDEDAPATLNVLANDHDPDGGALTIVAVTTGLHGSVAIVGSAIRYIPNADFNGTDGFDYTVSDGQGGTATAHVSVTVRAVNDRPVLTNPGEQRTDEGQPVSLQLEASDVDADSLTFYATGLPPGLRISTTGLISGTPSDRTARVYWVTVSVSDGKRTARQSFRWTVIDMSGRMTGEGEVAAGGLEHHFTFSVTERRNGVDHGRVELRIREADTPAKRGKQTNCFDASTITAVTFSDDPDFKPGRRALPSIDTVVFRGSGKWNGKAGYTFEARATDEGEPGAGRDTFAITIRNPHGVVVATVGGTLAAGNIQSLRLDGRR